MTPPLLFILAAFALLATACGTLSAPAASEVLAPGVEQAEAATAPPPRLDQNVWTLPQPAVQQPPFELAPAAWGEPPASLGSEAPAVSAAAAIVIDEASGAVLYEKDAGRQLAPASLTKIVTAKLVLESGIGLDTPVTVDVDSRRMRGSSVMGLQPGDVFTIRDLLYGLMLPSGNDAALALGRAVAGSDRVFVEKMNQLAWEMGLRDTRFANAHGLSAAGHYTSARDLAYLSRYAMSDPVLAEIVRTPSYIAYGSRTIELANVNLFLSQFPGADGLKTGFTNRAGKTQVATALRNGQRVYVVLLNAPDREADAIALMDWAFANYRWQ